MNDIPFRFLMATVAFEVGDDKIQKTLESHDIQVRDAVTSALESQTMEMLIRPGARDSLKQRLAEVVAGLKKEGMSVILSESDLQHSERLVDRIVAIDRGAIAAA